MKTPVIILLAMALVIPVTASAQSSPNFGPFKPLIMDQTVVQDVLVQDNEIYVKVAKDYWDKTLTVKISNEEKASYRTWNNGESEMAIKVYRAQQHKLLGYTYRINTSANYVEYWMDGRLVLHLMRIR